MEALEMALRRIKDVKVLKDSLIHHSDRGVQYASYEYTGRLKSLGIKISMTETGDPKDNAVAERVNNTIKNELLKDMEFFSIHGVKAAVEAAIDFYNNERPHESGWNDTDRGGQAGWRNKKKMDQLPRESHQRGCNLGKYH